VTATIGSGINGVFVIRRPNLVPGIPLYLYGDQYPGGKAFNNTPNQGGAGCKGPFCPPSGTAQGNKGRNALRGFGSYQWDMAVHREFPIGESLKLQFRAEVFNVLNHPNFGPPNGLVTSSGFGLATTMLNRSYNGDAAGSGGLTSLFQGGGPRSIQLGVKLLF
jgi:hypothetical protein